MQQRCRARGRGRERHGAGCCGDCRCVARVGAGRCGRGFRGRGRVGWFLSPAQPACEVGPVEALQGSGGDVDGDHAAAGLLVGAVQEEREPVRAVALRVGLAENGHAVADSVGLRRVRRLDGSRPDAGRSDLGPFPPEVAAAAVRKRDIGAAVRAAGGDVAGGGHNLGRGNGRGLEGVRGRGDRPREFSRDRLRLRELVRMELFRGARRGGRRE
ncbi:hypothetical protein D7I44_14925 [Gryllotalpicola protaetiae]|uniref:Uncharacterized protein n=1 Tax=Gryllotalpicola protaetiae TaxID=2419771 RepID=A0A387BUM1_9MICO|nr:hypothetical protein D7I44_14925 [Gryllotalpicola protaetiae]